MRVAGRLSGVQIQIPEEESGVRVRLRGGGPSACVAGEFPQGAEVLPDLVPHPRLLPPLQMSITPRKALPLVESAVCAYTVLGKVWEGEPGPLLRTKPCHQGCLLICIKGGLGLGMGLQPCPSSRVSSLAHSETGSSSDHLLAASESELTDPISLCLLQDPCLTVKWLQAQSGLQAPRATV